MNNPRKRILTTHVGSLARSPEAIRVIAASEREERYKGDGPAVIREAVESAVRRQVELGIDIVNDGEQSKPSFANYIMRRVSGYERRPGTSQGSMSNWSGTRERQAFPEYYEWYSQMLGDQLSAPGLMVCTGAVSYTGHDALRTDIDNLKRAAAAAGAERVFMTAISPSMVAARPNEYYGTQEEYAQAVADALREEYMAILDAGFLLQIDDSNFATHYTFTPTLSVEECRRWMATQVEVINYAIRGLPQERLRFHTCYSIDIGPRVNELGLAEFADILLKIDVGGYSFEASNPRHEHEYHVWESQQLPAGKVLIPGVISHTTQLVEHPQLIAERILRYTRIVGPDNVIAGADCGFAATARTQQEIHPTVAWAKLAALVEGARLTSAELAS